MESKSPFARRAARASAGFAFGALVLFLALFLGRTLPGGMSEVYQQALYALGALGVFGCLVLSIGMGFGALFGIKQHGRAGILVPAMIGLVLSALMLAPIVMALGKKLAAQAREPQRPTLNATNLPRP